MTDIIKYEDRFRLAIGRLCDRNFPPMEIVRAWLLTDDSALQEFCVNYGPSWSQGIAIIDAAHVIASQPPERPFGVEEDEWFETDPPMRSLSPLEEMGPIICNGQSMAVEAGEAFKIYYEKNHE